MKALLFAALALLPWMAAAQCSRPIQVPVAPIGLSLILKGNEVSGVYPDWLAELAPRIRCRFDYQVVPRARLNQMFELGQADLMMPATRTTPRDAFGVFVPLIRTRPALISLRERGLPALNTLGDLIARRELRVVVVRGFDFGDRYRQAVEVFQRQGRLVLEAEPAGVAKALQLGLADVTILTPSNFIGTLLLDERLRPMSEQLRLENVEEFPWSDSGVYLSIQRLTAADRRLLQRSFTASRAEVWKRFNHHYPPGSLGGSIAPIR